MISSKIIIDIVGWYGALALLAAYFLVSFNFIAGEGLVFQILNFTGAVAIIAPSIPKKDYQPAFLNIVWALIGLVALIKLLLKS